MAIDQLDRTALPKGPTVAAGQETVRTNGRRATVHDARPLTSATRRPLTLFFPGPVNPSETVGEIYY